MVSNCCIYDIFHHGAGYVFYSLLSRVQDCLIAVVYSVSTYALKIIDRLVSANASIVIFYSKLNGQNPTNRIKLVRYDNHYKHYLFDNWGAAKGTMNLTYYELELLVLNELEVNIARCRTRHADCLVASSVRSVVLDALKARPEAWQYIAGTSCEKFLIEGTMKPP